ncbi:MAG: M43 family zinc metalloprotease, partial [Verrucomicrobiales bacterium]|nr:M43 family zinc metalloprotease [Verrucomicrobiales bacterium]
AVNIYITGNSACSAIADFPPKNNIVIVCQSIFDPTIMHEIGHILNLYHTHETAGSDGGDECSDTIKDHPGWTRDQISYTNFSLPYASLSAAQKYQVDMVWSNLMSYHNLDYRWMLSDCQQNRMSGQASADQSWLLTKRPIYVDPARWIPFLEFGTFPLPYQTIQKAINAGVLNNRVLVLQAGTHAEPGSVLSTSTDVVPRQGAATIRDFKPNYDLPCNLEESPNPKLRDAILRVQLADQQRDKKAAIEYLLEAERHAAARERDAVRLELAQRYRDSGQLEEAEAWFNKLAAEADQPGLRERSRNKANDARAEIERRKQQQQQQNEPEPDNPQNPTR